VTTRRRSSFTCRERWQAVGVWLTLVVALGLVAGDAGPGGDLSPLGPAGSAALR
jgi:uncharacterized membrane protein YdfJ with MMPL/SSD domain